MANELQTPYTTGATLYAVIINPAAQAWNGTTFETITPADWSTYAVPLSEVAASGLYFGNFPTSLPAANYTTVLYQQVGGSPASTDTLLGVGEVDWSGTDNTSLADVITAAGQARDAAYSVLARLGTVQVVMTTPVTETGELEIITGADYYQADGRAVTWSNSEGGWPDLVGAAVTWEFRRYNSTTVLLTYSAEVINATTVQLELSAAQTSAIPYSVSDIRDTYELWATLTNGHKVRLATGPIYVGV